ncbi:hypothetical protein V8G54_012799 [Vigna mungo]|uniref:Uncharacterized protein n=1 Tax=Vigna mungo TaxID=3915 RepID=A0AAQ3NVI1_VIGMU
MQSNCNCFLLYTTYCNHHHLYSFLQAAQIAMQITLLQVFQLKHLVPLKQHQYDFFVFDCLLTFLVSSNPLHLDFSVKYKQHLKFPIKQQLKMPIKGKRNNN